MDISNSLHVVTRPFNPFDSIYPLNFTATADHPGGVKQQEVGAGTSEGRAVSHPGPAQGAPGTGE